MTAPGPRWRTAATALAALVLSVTATLAVPGVSAAAEPALRDGSSSGRAGGSCWQIKQSVPASADGVYWLQTPQLVVPQQFYCDMTTDGGGWVLVGRGRDGWTWSANGQGSAVALRGTVSGPGAFAPSALPAATVDGLLGGTRLDALTEGIRVRRATDEAGTSWQEMRLRPAERAGWSWSFGGGIRTSGVTIGGTAYAGGNTQSWAASGNQGLLRLTTTDIAAHNYRRGFAYGTQIGGANNATSHLWEYTTENQALPFTQVFLRPRTGNGGYAPVADAGTPASTVRPLLSTTTSTDTPWGVNGIVGGGSGELNMEVEDFAFVGDTVFVGGKFEYVQRGAAPAAGERVRQPYLAAFDVRTGAWRSGFRPVLDGTVWSLAATADGKLVVGGEFTSVNGVAGTSSLAALDPVTGAPAAGWRAPVTFVGDNVPNVRGLDVQDGWVYVGGRFNRIAGGSRTEPLQLSGAARVSAATGEPDATWKPHFDGTVFELDASGRGDRVYYAGRFDNVNFSPSPMFATVSTAPNAPLVGGLAPWVPAAGSGTNTYQQTVLEVGDSLWLGGSQHVLSRYDRAGMNFRSGNITRNGGDFQALAVVDGVLYAACHCVHYNYSGTTNYGNPIGGAADVDGIRFIGAWDAATGEYLPEFLVSGLAARNDMGPWAMRVDPYGCMWFGGDFTRGSWLGSQYQWLGGFGKLCPRDTTAPSPPTALTAAPAPGGVALSWGPGGDANGVQYEVLRDDRVVARIGERSYTDAGAVLPARYWVRAIDPEGNRSASTPVRVVDVPDTTAPAVRITSPAAGAQVSGDVPVVVDATDAVGVTAVQLVVDGAAVGTADTTAPFEFTWRSGAPGDRVLSARAVDAAGNAADAALVTVRVTADTTPPAQVTGVVVTATTSSTASLSWTAAPDDRGTTGYVVLRDGAPLAGSPPETTRTDSGLLPSTAYQYTVRAVDAAGNAGPPSAPVAATTAGDPGVLFSDTWTAADGAPWSAPWTTTTTSGSATVSGGAGSLAVTDAAGAYARAVAGGAAVADTELLVSYRWTDPSASAFFTVYLRGSGGWQNGYRPRNGYGLQLSSTSPTVQVQRNVNGTTTTLAGVTGAQSVGTGVQWLRLRAVGSTLQFRIWPEGQAEPTAWASTLTDTAVAAGGQLHVSLNRGGTNVGPKAVHLDGLVLRSAGP